MRPPKFKPPRSWEKFSLPFKIGSGRDFLPDAKGRQSLRMAFFRRGSDLALVGKVWFGEGIEGPPGHVHGGVSAYVLDEAMGCASWLRGYPTVARDIKVEFLKMTPIGQDFSIEAQVKQITRREVVVTAEIYLGREQIFSRAKGRFARLPKDRVLHFLEQSQLKVNVDQLIFP